jgi:hypothetical protein
LIQNYRSRHRFIAILSEISTERPRNRDKGRAWSTINRSKSFLSDVAFDSVDIYSVSELLRCNSIDGIGNSTVFMQ